MLAIRGCVLEAGGQADAELLHAHNFDISPRPKPETTALRRTTVRQTYENVSL